MRRLLPTGENRGVVLWLITVIVFLAFQWHHREKLTVRTEVRTDTVKVPAPESPEQKINRLSRLAGIPIPQDVNIKHLELMVATATYYDIPLRMFLRHVYRESEFNPRAYSSKGAKGYVQIMPQTFRDYRENLFMHRHTPENNIRISGLILRDLYQQFGSWSLALAAYNAGPYQVIKAGGIPMIGETRKHVSFVLKRAE